MLKMRNHDVIFHLYIQSEITKSIHADFTFTNVFPIEVCCLQRNMLFKEERAVVSHGTNKVTDGNQTRT